MSIKKTAPFTKLILFKIGTEDYPADDAEIKRFQKALEEAPVNPDGSKRLAWHHAVEAIAVNYETCQVASSSHQAEPAEAVVMVNTRTQKPFCPMTPFEARKVEEYLAELRAQNRL